FFVEHAVLNQVGDGADLELVLLGEFFQVRATRHGAVVIHDLDDHGGGFATGHAGEITTGFGMAGAVQHTTRLRHQRKYVARHNDVFRLCFTRHGDLHGLRAVGGRNAGGHAFGGFNRAGEVGAKLSAITTDHQRQFQLFATLLG